MGEVTPLTPPEPRRLYSWWWDSHISPKNSKWLQENLADIDSKVKMMIKLIEEDADSFSIRAEMYYEKRPELMKLVEHFYRAYRALAEQYDHATAELRHAHNMISTTGYPSHGPLPPAPESPPPLSSTNLFSPDLTPPTEGETEDVVRLLKSKVEQLTAERDTLLNERETLQVSIAVREAEARTLKERCSELEKTALLGWKADIECMSLEIRRGISALEKWGDDMGDVKDKIRNLKTESEDSLRNLLEENLNLRKEKEDLLENIQCERDTVYRELDALGKLLECSEQTTHANQLRSITVNLVKLLDKKTRLEERQLSYADMNELRASLDGERLRWLSFVLFCGARLALAEDEVRRLRQLAADTGGRYAELAKVSAELIAELEGECLIQKAEAEFLSGENGRLEAGISDISGFFPTDYTDGRDGCGFGETVGRVRDGLVRTEEERERLVVENSVLCVLLEGLSVSGAEAYGEIEKENESFAIELLDTSGMCVVLEDFGREKEAESGRLKRDLERVRRVNRRLAEELRDAEVGRAREVEIWEGEAAGFYFDLQVCAVWELVFENTVAQMVLRCSNLEKESCLMREKVRESEAEIESLRTRLSGYVTAMDSLRAFLRPDQAPQPSNTVEDSTNLLSDIERMQTMLKEATDEIQRLKAAEQPGRRNPKRGPRKSAVDRGLHQSRYEPEGNRVVVKDIILDRVSKEPILGLWEEGVQKGGVQPGDGSWTMSSGSSSSRGSDTDEAEKHGLQKIEKINDWWGSLIRVSKRPGLCACLRNPPE